MGVVRGVFKINSRDLFYHLTKGRRPFVGEGQRRMNNLFF